MIVMITSRAPRPYVAGVFADETAAREFLGRIPSELRRQMDMTRHPELSVPVFITEDDRGLRVTTPEGALIDLRARAKPRRDDDWVYTHLYRVDEPFIPTEPGRDEMGRLPHWHIENWHLDLIDEDGLSALSPAAPQQSARGGD